MKRFGAPAAEIAAQASNENALMRVTLTTRKISTAGKLLVQYKLALEGIETTLASAGTGHVETGTGASIQVYTNREPKPAGGNGRPALAWMLSGNSPADFIAVTDLSTDRAWLFRRKEAFTLAQQHPESGNHHLVMVTDRGLTSKHARILDDDFTEFLIERRANELLSTQAV
jgi:hypothetical protein